MSIIKKALSKMVGDKEKRHRLIIRTTGWMKDPMYLRLLYKGMCKKKLDIANPVTFNEKLQWYKLHYHDPLMTQCADKYAVRSYVMEQGYENLLVPLLHIYEDASEIDFDALPDKCILKCTHNSSGSVKWDRRRGDQPEEIRRRFMEMLKINAYWLSREWAYKDIEPRVICEQWISSQTPIIDIKFLCFQGKARYFFYDVGMNDASGNHVVGYRAVLDREGNEIDVETSMKRLPIKEVRLPSDFEAMLTYADRLSAAFPHVRVDFFVAEQKVYFSELTFYSGGGYGKFNPDCWDRKIGDCFQLPKIGERHCQ